MSPNTAPGSLTRVSWTSSLTTSTTPRFKNSSRWVSLPSDSTISPRSNARRGKRETFSRTWRGSTISMAATFC